MPRNVDRSTTKPLEAWGSSWHGVPCNTSIDQSKSLGSTYLRGREEVAFLESHREKCGRVGGHCCHQSTRRVFSLC